MLTSSDQPSIIHLQFSPKWFKHVLIYRQVYFDCKCNIHMNILKKIMNYLAILVALTLLVWYCLLIEPPVDLVSPDWSLHLSYLILFQPWE